MKIRAFAYVSGSLALACGLGMAVGCSSSSETTTTPGGDAGVDVDADDVTVETPKDAGTDTEPAACNALANVGSAVQQMFVATDPVAGDGGTIAPGTYVLTAASVYTGPSGNAGPTGATFTDTIALANGGTYQRVVSVLDNAGSDGGPVHQNGEFKTDGGGIKVITTCPVVSQPFTSYDSDGTKIHIYAPAIIGGPGLMFEYTKK